MQSDHRPYQELCILGVLAAPWKLPAFAILDEIRCWSPGPFSAFKPFCSFACGPAGPFA